MDSKFVQKLYHNVWCVNLLNEFLRMWKANFVAIFKIILFRYLICTRLWGQISGSRIDDQIVSIDDGPYWHPIAHL